MSNTGCLANLACPTCGNDFCLHIEVRTVAEVTEYGAETFGGIDWDDESWAECPECELIGTVRTFMVAAHDTQQPTTEE